MCAFLIHEGFLTAAPDGNGKCHSWMKLLYIKWHKTYQEEEEKNPKQNKTGSVTLLETRFLFRWISFCLGRKPFHQLEGVLPPWTLNILDFFWTHWQIMHNWFIKVCWCLPLLTWLPLAHLFWFMCCCIQTDENLSCKYGNYCKVSSILLFVVL